MSRQMLIGRMRAELWACLAIWGVLLVSGLAAQGPGQLVATDAEFSRWALQQGGLMVALMILAGFYRRDLMRMAEERKELAAEKDEHREYLVKLVEQSTQTIAKLTATVDALTVELRRGGVRS